MFCTQKSHGKGNLDFSHGCFMGTVSSSIPLMVREHLNQMSKQEVFPRLHS